MEITIEHVAEIGEELPRDVANAVEIIVQRVPDPDLVDLVVTGNFVASVRARAANRHEAAEYSPERGAGLAAAKTIPNGERSFIVIPAPLLSNARNTFEKLGRHAVAHEATHVTLQQRGEETSNIRLRLASSETEGYRLASAGVIAEEYRVEASLAAERDTPHNTHQISIVDALEAAREGFLDAILLRHPHESMDRPSYTALQTAHHLGIQLAYLAAELTNEYGVVPAQPPTTVTQSPLWERLIGPGWPTIATVLSEFPLANQETPRDILDQTVVDLADATRSWIKHIGFSWYDTNSGPYFEVLRHDF